MIIVILVIVTCILLINLVLLYFHYKEVKSVRNQLNLIINDYSETDLRTVSNLRYNKELVNTINQFLSRFNYLKKKYALSDQHNKMMISSIAHDFRTPLTSVLGYIQILQETDDEETRIKYLEIIEKRVNALSILIEDFYALSLLQSEEYPVNIAPVNVSLALIEQVALYHQDLKNKFEIININIEESSTYVESDILIIQRIVSNLIKNCLVHGEDTCSISYAESNSEIEITVSNSVTSNVEVNRIFERTYRQDKSRHLSSTGLGLSIAKQLAEVLSYNIIASQKNDVLSFKIVIKK